ncbi:hypothetical protein SAMN05720354_12615 [Nitrosospira sp. Nsp1]|nr:hypothetical protein SAMN05720354_12615 [Nitrosospira sp. Nsp1]
MSNYVRFCGFCRMGGAKRNPSFAGKAMPRERRYLMLDGDHIINMNKYDPSKYNLTDKEKEGVWTA